MRQLREVLRLKLVGGLAAREVAHRVGVVASTVRATIKRFLASALSWPLPEEVTDTALEATLFDEGRHQARAPPAIGARLGGHPSRTQSQVRHPGPFTSFAASLKSASPSPTIILWHIRHRKWAPSTTEIATYAP